MCDRLDKRHKKIIKTEQNNKERTRHLLPCYQPKLFLQIVSYSPVCYSNDARIVWKFSSKKKFFFHN